MKGGGRGKGGGGGGGIQTPSEIAAQRDPDAVFTSPSRFGGGGGGGGGRMGYPANEIKKPPELFPEITSMPSPPNLGSEAIERTIKMMDINNWLANSTYRVPDPTPTIKLSKYLDANAIGPALNGPKISDMYIPGCFPKELMSDMPPKNTSTRRRIILDSLGRRKKKKKNGDEDGGGGANLGGDEEEEDSDDDEDSQQMDDDSEDDNDYNIDYYESDGSGGGDGGDRGGGGGGRDDD